MLTTADLLMEHLDEENIIFRIYLSALYQKLNMPEKAYTLLSNVDAEEIKENNKKFYELYRFIINVFQQNRDIFNCLKIMGKVMYSEEISEKE